AASGGHLPSRVVSDLVSSEILTPEAREAISSGIVRENEMSYFCNLCQVPLTGDAPLNQHIKGTRHKKAQKVALQHQHLPDIGALTLTPDSRMLINSPNADHPPPTTNQTDLADPEAEVQDHQQASCGKVPAILRISHPYLPFQPGQQVLLDLPRGMHKVSAVSWDGPYTVQAEVESGYMVREANGRCKTVVRESCKLFTPGQGDSRPYHLKEDTCEPADERDRPPAANGLNSSAADLSSVPQPRLSSDTDNCPLTSQRGEVHEKLRTLSKVPIINLTPNSPQNTQVYTSVILGEDDGQAVVFCAQERNRKWKPSKVYHSRGTQTEAQSGVPTITCGVQTYETFTKISGNYRQRHPFTCCAQGTDTSCHHWKVLLIDGVLPFPWTVKSCASPIPPSEKVYRNLSTPRGLVCIFNYHFSGQNTRLGARTDSHNLKTLFTRMGYRVYLYEDLTKQGTLDQLKNIQQDKDLAIYDSFILIVLSHGVKDLMFCTNGIELTEKLSLDDVRYHFVDGSCPNLRNKPKIFLANFCRGETQEESRSLQTDSITSQITNAPQDMKTIYASINNFRALRDPGRGTVFVQALCDVLANHAHDSELSDLYLELCKNMQSKAGTTPEEQNYRFKQFYFNPL
ncbi:caspase-2-like 4, partial [Homarus americanus]